MLDLMKLHESIEEIPPTNKPMISHDARTASESRFSFSTPIKKRSGGRCRVGEICLLYAVVPINAVTVSFDLQAALRQEIVKVSD